MKVEIKDFNRSPDAEGSFDLKITDPNVNQEDIK